MTKQDRISAIAMCLNLLDRPDGRISTAFAGVAFRSSNARASPPTAFEELELLRDHRRRHVIASQGCWWRGRPGGR
jgi:hypothetical protein